MAERKAAISGQLLRNLWAVFCLDAQFSDIVNPMEFGYSKIIKISTGHKTKKAAEKWLDNYMIENKPSSFNTYLIHRIYVRKMYELGDDKIVSSE